ncbi:Bisdemethoxycurcumin synthase, partial [Dichanthelium oligosanthes]
GRVAGLERRFFHHTEQVLNANPGFLQGTPSTLDARLDIVAKAAPELAASAAAKAIARWGRPATDITHLVVSTSSEARSPGVDLGLASLLGLRPDVCRTVLQLNGCSAGCAALRLAKDLAENNRGARVLVACVELTITSFRAPRDGDSFDTLIPQALFGDGAGAVVVGADAVHPAERPLFEMVSASQALIPGSEQLLNMRLGEGGIDGNISSNLPRFAAQNLERCLLDAFRPLAAIIGTEWKWNDLFWAVHPGSLGILDHIDSALRLDPKKLAASRTVVRDYGNMLSATVIFVLDELRRRMDEEGDEAAEWGVMVGFGAGFTVETMVLHATAY